MFPGAQVTLASVSVPAYFMPLRRAGAQARKVLLDNVAEQWKVPVAELTTEKSMVIHKKSKRSISYGDVAKFAKVPAELPKIEDSDLKKREDFKLIGRKDIRRVDVPSKVNGTAKYGIDVQVPGMVYASLLHAPMDGVKVESVNADEVKKIKGVTHVLSLPFGVAVVGDTVEASRAGRMALKVKWDTSGAKAAPFNSEKAKEEYATQGQGPERAGQGGVQGRRRRHGARRRGQDARGDVLVRAHLPRPDGADERRRQSLGRTAHRRKSGSARRCSRWPRRSWRACSRPRPTRSRSTCNCSAAASAGASGRTRRCRRRCSPTSSRSR